MNSICEDGNEISMCTIILNKSFAKLVGINFGFDNLIALSFKLNSTVLNAEGACYKV